MPLLISLIITLFPPSDLSSKEIALIGKWGLVTTELYKENTISGRLTSEEISTYYHFDIPESTTENGNLYVNEDGNIELFIYRYDAKKEQLTIGNKNVLTIERLTTDELIFYKDYGTYRSRYIFRKEV